MLQVAVFIINVVLSALTCPYSNLDEVIGKRRTLQTPSIVKMLSSTAKCSRSTQRTRIPDIAISTSALDIFSDVLIVSIPAALLWNVRLAVRQKIGLAATLCLSAVMAIVAIIRLGDLQLPGGHGIDDVWAEFWVQQECSIAVPMVSITASRALFVVGQHHQTEQGSRSLLRYFFSVGSIITRHIRSFFRMNNQIQEEESSLQYPIHPTAEIEISENTDGGQAMIIRSTAPRIPSATMTGVRTVINDGGHGHYGI